MFKKILLVSAVSLLLNACAMKTTHFVNSDNGFSLDNTQQVTDDTDYFIGGIFQSENISAQNACGSSDKVVATQTYRSASNFFLSLITFGIYAPQEQTVFCKK
jgi:outer membrane biogenesis lipoprotein LolB